MCDKEIWENIKIKCCLIAGNFRLAFGDGSALAARLGAGSGSTRPPWNSGKVQKVFTQCDCIPRLEAARGSRLRAGHH